MSHQRKGFLTDIPGILVGHAQNEEALTGCTAVLFEGGAVCSVDVRGSAPGTRETDLLDPVNAVEKVHAICLSGGSAFGLDAASGVAEYLEEQGIGLDVGVAKVPIVPSAILFDLAVGSASIRPDREMGHRAASAASGGPFAEGNAGAGCGASVGKLAGFERAMKSGLGTASLHLPNGLIIGALVAVNAVGEIRNPENGERIAGILGEDGKMMDAMTAILEQPLWFHDRPTGTNTTIGVVASNANLTKTQLKKVAEMSHDGLARTIYPVHTMHDGDTIFAAATGEVDMPTDVVGALSAEVLAKAVLSAVRQAESAGGLKASRDVYV